MNKNKIIKELEAQKGTYKELYKTYLELFTSSTKELQFARLQEEYLYSVLDELKSFSNGLEKSVISNAMERYQLDKLIHSKLLFKDDTNKYE